MIKIKFYFKDYVMFFVKLKGFGVFNICKSVMFISLKFLGVFSVFS